MPEGYKRTYGLGLLGGVDFDYKLTRSMTLALRPSFSYGLFSATAESNVLDAKFFRYGVSLGLKYKL